MNKLNLKPKTLILILTFGLISCSKESPGQRSDSFAVSTPIVHARMKTRAGENFSPVNVVKLDSKISEAIYPTSIVEIESIKTHSFSVSPISLNVTSNCRSANTSRSFQKTFKNTASFQLMSLLEPDHLIELSKNQTNTTCDMNFVFNNQIGSSQSFMFKEITIAPLPKEEISEINLVSYDESGREFDPRLPIVTENRNPLQKLPLFSQTRISFNSRSDNLMSLVCENFISQLNSKARSDISLSIFENAKTIWQKQLPAELKGLDPRQSVPAQDCRIMYATSGQEHSIKFSRQFRMVNRNQDLKIKLTTNSKLFSGLGKTGKISFGNNIEIFHLEIVNPSNAPLAVALGNVQMQVLANYDIGRLDYHEGFTRALNIQIEGGQTIWQDATLGKVVHIPPASRVDVSYQLAFNSTCLVVNETMSIDIKNHTYAEIWARSLSNLIVVQLANPIVENLVFHPEYYKVFSQVEGGTLPAAQWTTEKAGNIYCDNFNQQK